MTFTRKELIEEIMMFQAYAGTGEETQSPYTVKKLDKLNNNELIAIHEDQTTNYGEYAVVDN